MRRLLIATFNRGKLPEIAAELMGLPLEIVVAADADLSLGFAVEETEPTFEGNAILKAKVFGKQTGLLTLADDSGLEVDALGGRPGVYSARYAAGTDEDRRRKLLGELQGVADGRRGAQFRCVVAIYDPTTERLRTCEGIYRGRILGEPRGANGFGFDPVFWNEKLGKTNGEMTMEEKNTVSHRGAAVRKAREILEREFLS